MTTSYMLAVDAGTGSGRAVIFDENGTQIASAQHEWWHRADPRFPGSMDFDVEGNWSLLSRAIRQAIAEARIAPADIRVVSATSMREAPISCGQTCVTSGTPALRNCCLTIAERMIAR